MPLASAIILLLSWLLIPSASLVCYGHAQIDYCRREPEPLRLYDSFDAIDDISQYYADSWPSRFDIDTDTPLRCAILITPDIASHADYWH